MRRCEGELGLSESWLMEQSRECCDGLGMWRRWKKITRSDVRFVRPRGRPRTGWMDSVKRVLDPRGMSVEQGRVVVCGRNGWRAVVNA